MKIFVSDVFLGKLTSMMIIILCFGYPISAILSLVLDIPSTYVNGTFRGIVLLLGLFILSLFFIKNKNKLVFSKYSISLVLFLFVYSLRLIWDLFIISIYTEHSKFEICSFFIGNILIPIFVVLFTFKFCSTKKIILNSYYILIIDNLIILLFYFIQNNWNFSPEILMERAAIKGMSDDLLLINPISFGIYGGYLILTSTTFLLFLKNLVPRKLAYFFICIGFINLILSTSRGPFLFTLIGVIILLFLFISFSKQDFRLWRRIILFLTFVSGLVLFIITKFEQDGFQIGIIQRAISMKENIQSGEKEGRNDLYSEGFDMFLESPIFGKKLVLESTASYPHNIFIEIMMSTGIIGLSIYFITLICFLIKIFNLKNHSLNLIFFLAVFFLAYGISLTTGNIYQSIESWLLLALILNFKPKELNFI